MTAAQLVAVLIVVAVATCGLTGVVVRQLRRWSILDHPNVRSSHSAPTPRGGGLAVVTVLMAAWALFAFTRDSAPMDMAWLIVLAIFLAVVSWFDDLKGLSVLLRLTAQIGAVTVFMAVVPAADPYFLGLLPPVFDRLVAGCLWLWFVNLFNFMDGIDGMAAGETASIGIGIVLVAALAGLDDHDGSMGFAGMTLAAAALGFLVWNWHPAKVFLGDVGSIPLGFLIGWLLLELAVRGQPVAALILPLYYLTDATVTLGRRLLRGEHPWRAHKDHFYQRAVLSGLTHAAVVLRVFVANAFLIALAGLAAIGHGLLALVGGCLVTASLLFYLAYTSGRRY